MILELDLKMRIEQEEELKHKGRDAVTVCFELPLPLEMTIGGGSKVEFFKVVIYKESVEDELDYDLDAENLNGLKAYYINEGTSGFSSVSGSVSATEDVHNLIETIVEQVRLSIKLEARES